MISRWLSLLFLSALLASCSSGRHSSQERIQDVQADTELSSVTVAAILQPHDSSDCDRDAAELAPNDRNTVFVHPGLLLFGLDWGGHRAVDTGLLLVREGYGGNILEVRSRQAGPVYQRMLEDVGTRFLGIHYSMGGEPRILANALQASAQASKARQQTLIYNPFLVEPFGFASLYEQVDLDSPHLGQTVVLVSSDNATFRPDIEAAPSQVLNHPKLHIIYPSDYGLQWDHFSVLSDLRESADSSEPKHRRAYELFQVLAESMLIGLESRQLDSRLARLKLRYALEDKRPLQPQWRRQLMVGDCEPAASTTPGR